MNFWACCKVDRNDSFRDNNVAYKNKSLNKHGRSISFFLRTMSRKTRSSRYREIADEVLKLANAKVTALGFSYQELLAATDDFSCSCVIGEGGFGRVYKGHVESIDQVVAIKQLDKKSTQGNREFFSEIMMLSMVDYTKLVKLIGYCVDDDHRLLVYEYMAKGSLEDHLLDLPAGKQPLDWNKRMKIAMGAAQGLEYLHDSSIIYRDFKTSNILLDDNFNVKLSDFGLAKLGPKEGKEYVSTRVMGTYGYCAPEYQRTGKLTKKSDVYSYGVVFLEIITGRRVIDTKKPPEEQNLICWAEPFLKDRNKFTRLADPKLQGNYNWKNLYQALAVAAMCLQQDSEARPSMSDVVSALEFLAKSADTL